VSHVNKSGNVTFERGRQLAGATRDTLFAVEASRPQAQVDTPIGLSDELTALHGRVL
jgi:hypothetical protein